jgi:hypothetical protein
MQNDVEFGKALQIIELKKDENFTHLSQNRAFYSPV